MSLEAPSALISTEAARQNVDKLGIRYDELPKLPFWSVITGKSNQDMQLSIARSVMASASLINRALTQPETDALAQHYSRCLVTNAWDTPIILASTAAFYRGTYKKYGFPFYTPNPDKFNPNKFFLLAENPMAPKFWHSMRLFAWYFTSKLVVGITMGSYIISVYTKNYGADPRLEDYREAVRKTRTPARQPPGSQQSRPGFPAREEPSVSWPSTAQSDEQSTQDAQSPWPATQSSQPESAQDPFKADEPYEFDDASPVAPTSQQRGAQQPTQGASAWDRIRKQAQPSAAANQGSARPTGAWDQKRQDELTSRGARDGSSFSYTSADEEKAYAKEQAQKEFDELLERERRGEASGRR